MKKILDICTKINKKNNRIFIILGSLFSAIAYLPNLILQKGSVFKYQDQLDGEIFTYIFSAKYLGQNVTEYQEMFNGIYQNGLTMPAPIFVFLFKIFDPFSALLLMHISVSVIAFIGMYLLVEKCLNRKIIAFIAGLTFAYLPFLGVYGLSIMGIPLLVYAFLLLYEDKNKLYAYVIIFFFACASSLALVGVPILINLCVFVILLLLRKGHKKCRALFWGVIELTITYLLFNFSLLQQVLSFSGEAMVSHKEVIYVYAIPFFSSFKEFFLTGSFHMQSYHSLIVLATLITILFGLLKWKSSTDSEKKILSWILKILLYNVLIATLCSVFAIKPIVDFRNEIGGAIKYFQLNRLSWILPFTWYFIFALIMLYWTELVRKDKNIKWMKYAESVFLLGLVFAISGNVLYNSTFKVNVRQMVDPATSNSITWDKYYNEKLFVEIDEYIGKPKDEYRVVSLGIFPSMPLYSGFYCLDGYSNNYNLNYKYEFRKIMEEELEKNEALRMYYDNWGNRCYLLADELGQNFFFEKGNQIQLCNLELNTEQLYNMGGRYLFSGVQIKNDESIGLEFERYFENENSSIGIYLYKIEEENLK